MASSRIQRWALTLSAYRYQIRYIPGSQLNNSDALSRLPLPCTTDLDGLTGDHIHLLAYLSGTEFSVGAIRKSSHSFTSTSLCSDGLASLSS